MPYKNHSFCLWAVDLNPAQIGKDQNQSLCEDAWWPVHTELAGTVSLRFAHLATRLLPFSMAVLKPAGSLHCPSAQDTLVSLMSPSPRVLESEMSWNWCFIKETSLTFFFPPSFPKASVCFIHRSLLYFDHGVPRLGSALHPHRYLSATNTTFTCQHPAIPASHRDPLSHSWDQMLSWHWSELIWFWTTAPSPTKLLQNTECEFPQKVFSLLPHLAPVFRTTSAFWFQSVQQLADPYNAGQAKPL